MWRFPSAKGPSCKPFVPCGPDVLGRHVGFHPSFIDEDQLARIRPALEAFPLLAAVALVRHERQLLAGDVAGSQKASNRGDARLDAPPTKQVLQPCQRDRRTGIDPLKGPRPVPRQLRRAARAIRLGLTDPVSERHRAYSFAL